MNRKPFVLVFLAILVFSVPLAPQGRLPLRGTFDDRLNALEERLAAIEDRLARADEARAREPRDPSDRLTLESEAKLDRLEVRVIQLESNAADCECGGAGQRLLLDRLRSIERQVGRIRSSAIR